MYRSAVVPVRSCRRPFFQKTVTSVADAYGAVVETVGAGHAPFASVACRTLAVVTLVKQGSSLGRGGRGE